MEAVKVMSQLREVKVYLRSVFKHCINSVNAKSLVKNEMRVENDELIIRGNSYKLMNNCYVVGFGKGVVEMASATHEVLKGHLKKGILSVPEGVDASVLPKNIQVFNGAKNNVPDTNAEIAAKNIVELISPLTENDNLFVLISGGGSALLPCPIPPVTLKEKLEVTTLLQNKGATIIEVNSVRRKLSQVKGGKLAKIAYPAQVVSFILSDIIGDPLDYIASGPTVPDLSMKFTCIEILKKYGIFEKVPDSVIKILTREEHEDKADYFVNTKNYIIGNNSIALNAASEMALKDGHVSQIVTNTLQGRVEVVSYFLAKFACLVCQALTKVVTREIFVSEMEKLEPMLSITAESVNELAAKLYSIPPNKLLLFFGGETSVEVKGSGIGGRNQELALRFSMSIDELAKTMHVTQLFHIVLLCGGTDGIDGPTDAAGAIAYNGQTQIAENQGLPFADFIMDNDSYNFFSKLNGGEDLIKIGHTGTNVMDVSILSIQSKA